MIKELAWRMILPALLLTPGFSTTVSDWLVTDWHHCILLAPRFLLFLIFLRGQFNLLKVLGAYIIEAIAFSFIGWLFGRSIM